MTTIRRAAVLLPLYPHEVPILLDALNHLADSEETGDDPLSYAPDCDRVATRLRAYMELQALSARELLKDLGLGSYEDRRQG
jgi:hypothetical protein